MRRPQRVQVCTRGGAATPGWLHWAKGPRRAWQRGASTLGGQEGRGAPNARNTCKKVEKGRSLPRRTGWGGATLTQGPRSPRVLAEESKRGSRTHQPPPLLRSKAPRQLWPALGGAGDSAGGPTSQALAPSGGPRSSGWRGEGGRAEPGWRRPLRRAGPGGGGTRARQTWVGWARSRGSNGPFCACCASAANSERERERERRASLGRAEQGTREAQGGGERHRATSRYTPRPRRSARERRLAQAPGAGGVGERQRRVEPHEASPAASPSQRRGPRRLQQPRPSRRHPSVVA